MNTASDRGDRCDPKLLDDVTDAHLEKFDSILEELKWARSKAIVQLGQLQGRDLTAAAYLLATRLSEQIILFELDLQLSLKMRDRRAACRTA